ncbi:hypothetical protein Lfu02_68160 [Longispora fulva]|nr:hypothetical protein Lfu02_68160 [Longispora fulva]
MTKNHALDAKVAALVANRSNTPTCGVTSEGMWAGWEPTLDGAADWSCIRNTRTWPRENGRLTASGPARA